MRQMLQAALTMVLVLGSGAFAADAPQTWTGIISDSHCGAIHKSDIEHGGRITARECIVGREGDPKIPGCVSAKNGAKFVVVAGDRVYQVANQDFADLRLRAADRVTVTGTIKGEMITVTKLALAK